MEPVVALALTLATVAAAVAWRERRARRDATATAVRARRDLERAAGELDTVRADRDQVLELAGPGIVTLDVGSRVTSATPAAHALLRRSAGSLVGRTCMEAFLDPAVEEAVTSAHASGGATTEIRPAGPDGPTIVARIRRRSSGGLWVFLDDVSELRRLQRIRTEFIDNLSHELRTPLTTVSLLAETLARDADAAADTVPVRVRDRIAKIEVETGHLVQMVSEIMDLSRIESGGPLQLLDGLDIGAIASESAERLRLFAERQGVDLRVSVDPGLPHVRGDAARLGQVVVNLVHNAVKFSPDGGEVVVRTVSGTDPTEVVVSVADQGIGIPRAARDRVFERFYKVDRARLRPEVGGGTGLGLAIARHVVEQHGGRIWVDSEEGVGSTFSFALPASAANPDPAHP